MTQADFDGALFASLYFDVSRRAVRLQPTERASSSSPVRWNGRQERIASSASLSANRDTRQIQTNPTWLIAALEAGEEFVLAGGEYSDRGWIQERGAPKAPADLTVR